MNDAARKELEDSLRRGMTIHKKCVECGTTLTDDNRAFFGCQDECPHPASYCQSKPPDVAATAEILKVCPLHGERDLLAAYCTACLATHEPWEPTCGKCSTPLVQDANNRFRIFCPSCLATSKLNMGNN